MWVFQLQPRNSEAREPTNKYLLSYFLISALAEPLFTGTLHPCDIIEYEYVALNQSNLCCHAWTKKMGNNLKAIMKVMRIINGRGKSGLNVTEFSNEVSNLTNFEFLITNICTISTFEG